MFLVPAIRGLASAIDRAFEDSLSEHDEERIEGLCNSFGIDASELGPVGMRFAKHKNNADSLQAASGIPQ